MMIDIVFLGETIPYEVHPCETCDSIARRFTDFLVRECETPEPPPGWKPHLRDGRTYLDGPVAQYAKPGVLFNISGGRGYF